MNDHPSILSSHALMERTYHKEFHFRSRCGKVAIQFQFNSMFQKNENLLLLPFTQKSYQKTSPSVHDLIFTDTAIDLLIN